MQYNIEQKRGGGKSTTLLRQALALLSSGHNGVFVSCNVSLSVMQFRRAVGMLKEMGIDSARYEDISKTLRTEKGFLKFVSFEQYKDWQIGYSRDMVGFFDDYDYMLISMAGLRARHKHLWLSWTHDETN